MELLNAPLLLGLLIYKNNIRKDFTVVRRLKVMVIPTENQEQLFIRHTGACRFVWNYMLDLQQKHCGSGNKCLSISDMNGIITKLKQDDNYKWMNEVPSESINKTCREFNKAYMKSVKDKHNITFKSRKHSKQSYPLGDDGFYFSDENHIVIEGIGEMECKIEPDMQFDKNGMFLNPRVVRENGNWYITFDMEVEE